MFPQTIRKGLGSI